MLPELVCHAGDFAGVIHFIQTRMRGTVNAHDLFTLKRIKSADEIFGHFILTVDVVGGLVKVLSLFNNFFCDGVLLTICQIILFQIL